MAVAWMLRTGSDLYDVRTIRAEIHRLGYAWYRILIRTGETY
jgi:hypothetical protein